MRTLIALLALAACRTAAPAPAARPPAMLTRPPAPGKWPAIRGVVRDSERGDVLAGVTVVAVGVSDRRTRSAITDGAGSYSIHGLPAGAYVLSFYYSDVTVRRVVQLDGVDADVDITLDHDQGAGIILLRGTAADGSPLDHALCCVDQRPRHLPHRR